MPTEEPIVMYELAMKLWKLSTISFEITSGHPSWFCSVAVSGKNTWFQGGLVFKTCVSLNSRLESNKEEEDTCAPTGPVLF